MISDELGIKIANAAKNLEKNRKKYCNSGSKSFAYRLNRLGLKKFRPPYVETISDRFKRVPVVIIFLISVVFSVGFGFVTGCSSSIVTLPCSTKTYYQEKTQLIENGKLRNLGQGNKFTDLPQSRDKIKEEVIEADIFNGNAFRGALLFSAFLIAFTQWHLGGRQSAMSEMFERKQKSNVLILDHKAEIEELVSAAIEAKKYSNTHIHTDTSEIVELLEDFHEKSPHGSKKASLIQRMFVYIELDNLEFAYAKFKAELLDSEQMFRACEIFESRCQSALFRHLAAKQGLAYYTEDLHDLIVALLIEGFEKSESWKRDEH